MKGTPYQRAITQVHATRNLAIRADAAQISATIEDLMACVPPGHGWAARAWVARSRLDPDVVAFLTRARTLTLAATASLRVVLDVHAPPPSGAHGCSTCRTHRTCRTVRELAAALATELPDPAP